MITWPSGIEVKDGLPLRQIRELVRGRKSDDLVDDEIARAVERASQAGASWSAIAESLSARDADELVPDVRNSQKEPA